MTCARRPASACHVLCVLKGKSAEGARAIMRVIVLIAKPVPSPSRPMPIVARVRRCVNVCYPEQGVTGGCVTGR